MNTDTDTDLADRFGRAADYLQHLVNELDQNTLLVFYGLYKQATVGRCNTSKPGIFSMQARAKWNAWNDLKDMSTETAMLSYVNKLSEIKPNWNDGSDGDDGDGEQTKKSYWVSVSTPMDANDAEQIADTDKTLIDFVKEGNIEKVQNLLQSSDEEVIDAYDANGLCAIHWAADRGNADILELLLLHGANVNAQDKEGEQTALHYSAGCGHLNCVEILLKFNADPNIVDSDAATCLDLAIEANEHEIVAILKNLTVKK